MFQSVKSSLCRHFRIPQKGGRIGLVASTLGSALNLKPIISCNEDGIYYTVSKALGRKRASKAMDLAVNFAGNSKNTILQLFMVVLKKS